jgi:hypothetical protein
MAHLMEQKRIRGLSVRVRSFFDYIIKVYIDNTYTVEAEAEAQKAWLEVGSLIDELNLAVDS